VPYVHGSYPRKSWSGAKLVILLIVVTILLYRRYCTWLYPNSTPTLGALWLGWCAIILHITTTIFEPRGNIYISILAYKHFEWNAKVLGVLMVIIMLNEQLKYDIWLWIRLIDVCDMILLICTRICILGDLIGIKTGAWI